MLEQLLNNLFKFMDDTAINYVIARGFKTLPEKLEGGDIDIILDKQNEQKVINYISNLDGIYITSFAKRYGTTNLFLCWFDGNKIDGVQIDLMTNLNYKGITYLNVDKILAAKQKYKNFYVACDSHQQILHLLPHYFYTKQANPKYPDLGDYNASEYNNFIGKNWLQALVKMPVYYLYELRNILLQPYRTRLVFLGPDGAGKSTAIEGLLNHINKMVKLHRLTHLKPVLFLKKRSASRGTVTDPHGKPKRSWFSSNLKLMMYLAEYWLDFYKKPARTATLDIYDRYIHDLQIDAERYRFGGSKWLAKIVCKLCPKPYKFILINADANTIQARKSEVPPEVTAKQCKQYQEFIKQVNGIVIDGNKNVDEVQNELLEELANTLNQRSLAKL